jgi:hypothetical protein
VQIHKFMYLQSRKSKRRRAWEAHCFSPSRAATAGSCGRTASNASAAAFSWEA